MTSLSGGGPVTLDVCVCFVNSLEALTEYSLGQVPLTIGNCLHTCFDDEKIWGGVGNGKCRACFTRLSRIHSTADQTLLLKTVVMAMAEAPNIPRWILRYARS